MSKARQGDDGFLLWSGVFFIYISGLIAIGSILHLAGREEKNVIIPIADKIIRNENLNEKERHRYIMFKTRVDEYVVRFGR